MKEISNLDELLNSFIDDELPPRQHTEVQRLLDHDETISHRLEQLQQCRILLGSLPVSEAPPRILENVKDSLARRAIVGQEPLVYDEQVGARHLLGRKALAVAAMLGLITILAAVVYSIMAPVVPNSPIAVEPQNTPSTIDLTEPVPAIAAAAPFSGRLELQTNALPAVVGFINRTIEETLPSDEWIKSDKNDSREPHTLVCSGESFDLLLAELDSIWDKLDSATLFVDTDVFTRTVAVEAITPKQIADIVNQDDSVKRIELAKDFALLNNVTEHLPGKEILFVIDNTPVDLITPPKPVLTSNHKNTQKLTSRTGANKNIHLTITVTDNQYK